MSEERIPFELEIPVKASPHMLFPYLSTPSGLARWFSEDVNSRGEEFTFIWEGEERTARRIAKKNDHLIRFRWVDDEEDDQKYYFEFRIQVDELTNDASLIITDYSEEDDIEEDKMLWESQVNELLHIIGS